MADEAPQYQVGDAILFYYPGPPVESTDAPLVLAGTILHIAHTFWKRIWRTDREAYDEVLWMPGYKGWLYNVKLAKDQTLPRLPDKVKDGQIIQGALIEITVVLETDITQDEIPF